MDANNAPRTAAALIDAMAESVLAADAARALRTRQARCAGNPYMGWTNEAAQFGWRRAEALVAWGLDVDAAEHGEWKASTLAGAMPWEVRRRAEALEVDITEAGAYGRPILPDAPHVAGWPQLDYDVIPPYVEVEVRGATRMRRSTAIGDTYGGPTRYSILVPTALAAAGEIARILCGMDEPAEGEGVSEIRLRGSWADPETFGRSTSNSFARGF